MQVASRMLKETIQDKCPLCKEGWSNFIIITENLWACYKCGCVFVPRNVREREKSEMKGKVLQKHADLTKPVEEIEVPSFPCPQCGFVAKSRAGLVKHLTTHDRKEEE